MKGVNSSSGFNIRERSLINATVHNNCIVFNNAFGNEGSLCPNFVGFTDRCKTEGMSADASSRLNMRLEINSFPLMAWSLSIQATIGCLS
jgi:hypothetical protein